MVSLGEEDDVKRYALLGWFQTLILAGLITGTAWILGGARTWVVLPAYMAIGTLIFTQIIRIILTRDSVLFRFDWGDAWVVLFVLYACARYLTSPVEYVARLEWMTILSCATIFWMARYSLTHSSQGVFLLYILALNGLGLAIFSIWLGMHPGCHPFGEDLAQHYAPRLIGPFGCPNHLGDFLLIATSATLGLALFIRGLWVVRVALFYMAGLMIVVIGLTLSRGSWLGLVFVLLAVTIFSVRHSSLQWFFPVGLYLLSLIAGVLVIFHFPLSIDRIEEIYQHIEQHTLDQYARIQLIHDSLRIWRDHFWWGSGMASFNFEHQRFQNPHFPVHAYYAHNDYLNTLADYGLVGIFLVLGFLLTVTFSLFRRVDHRAPSSRRILLCASVAAWMGVCIHCFVDFNLHIPVCAFSLFLVTGLGLRRSNMGGLHLPYGERQLVHGAFALFLTVVLIAFMGKCWQTASGYYPYWRAVSFSSKLEPNSTESILPLDEALPLLTRSSQEDPQAPDTLSLLGHLYEGEAFKASNPRDTQSLALASISWFQACLQFNPLDDYPMLHMGEVYDLLKRPDEALFCFETIVQHQPYNGYFRQALAAHLRRSGRIPEAIAAYQAAVTCPYGAQGALEILGDLTSQLPTPIDPYHHEPTLP
jgi:O-antigen ligase